MLQMQAVQADMHDVYVQFRSSRRNSDMLWVNVRCSRVAVDYIAAHVRSHPTTACTALPSSIHVSCQQSPPSLVSTKGPAKCVRVKHLLRGILRKSADLNLQRIAIAVPSFASSATGYSTRSSAYQLQWISAGSGRNTGRHVLQATSGRRMHVLHCENTSAWHIPCTMHST